MSLVEPSDLGWIKKLLITFFFGSSIGSVFKTISSLLKRVF